MMDPTPENEGQQGPTVLEAALGYRRRGWSIIPIEPGEKKPMRTGGTHPSGEPKRLRWEPYQSKRPDEQKLGEWFGNGKNYGLAVILGDVSGGLVCRDFDTMEGYEQWAADSPALLDRGSRRRLSQTCV
jgi:hypothetical protein